MDIFIGLIAVVMAFGAAMLAWPVDRRPSFGDRYNIYGR